MIRYFCDACDVECKDVPNTAEIPCHIVENKRGYIDQDMNQVSGRRVTFHVCNKCWNDMWNAAFAVLKAKK